MKLKNGTILHSVDALNKLASSDLPIKVVYNLKKNIEILNDKLKFINERRNELIRKYGHDDRITQDDQEAMQSFINDFNEILEIEEEVDIKTFTLEELDGSKISATDLSTIIFMIKEAE
ncbi:hypothetical protein [Massilimicrobiota sp. An134]|uniref:hypothetical protein n=1 Tax=Massilimicrobiota sp. An134 TaxID=1965557 RepID=UPI000B3A4499|nr:hypothetical protein [Massilimicrobiota sp. An134]OUQ31124.1 hypothetical protein B5E79_00405 [Massilimicrobiota sp. An134]